MSRLLTAFIVLLAASHVHAEDIFVDNVRGDDRNTGDLALPTAGTNGPIATIGKALRIARKGDRIILANNDQPYRESITLQGRNGSGFPSTPLTIQGNGAILDGTAPVPPEAWRHIQGDVYAFTPVYKSHQQLYLEGKPVSRREIQSLLELDQLEPLTWALIEGTILFCTEKDTGPSAYPLAFSAQRTGITLYEVRHVRIVDLTVQGFQLDGINVHSNCYDVDLQAITSRGNGRSGISVGGASRVRLRQSLLGDNAEAQLRGEGFSKTIVEESTLLENTAPAVYREEATVEVDGQEVTGNLPT